MQGDQQVFQLRPGADRALADLRPDQLGRGAGAPVGTQAAILVRAMAADGTTGSAYLYAVAERSEDTIVWPTYQGIPASGSGAVTDARPDGAAAPTRDGRPPDSGSTTIAGTA